MPISTAEPLDRLAYLAEVLETGKDHPDWPADFRWSFTQTRCCAIALAYHLYGHEPEGYPACDRFLREKYGVRTIWIDRLFYEAPPHVRMRHVAPQHVAASIRKYLAAEEAAAHDAPLANQEGEPADAL